MFHRNNMHHPPNKNINNSNKQQKKESSPKGNNIMSIQINSLLPTTSNNATTTRTSPTSYNKVTIKGIFGMTKTVTFVFEILRLLIVFSIGFIFGYHSHIDNEYTRGLHRCPPSNDITAASTTTAAAAAGIEPILTTNNPETSQIQKIQTNNNDRNNNNFNGWNSVDVFYGIPRSIISSYDSSTSNNNNYNNNNTWLSQTHQDEAVIEILNDLSGGYFIDLAANDATTLSNTYVLEKRYNWTGLCIEPNPMYWYNLSMFRPNCQIVAAVVGSGSAGAGAGTDDTSSHNNDSNNDAAAGGATTTSTTNNNNNKTLKMEKIHFIYEFGDHGGIVGTRFDNRPKFKSKSQIAYTIPLYEIFQRYNVPNIIDYISLDVEGAEEYIMEYFPFNEYKFRVLTIERPKELLCNILEKNGYKQIGRLSSWGETLWIHQEEFWKSHTSTKDQFNLTNILRKFDPKLLRLQRRKRQQEEQQKKQKQQS